MNDENSLFPSHYLQLKIDCLPASKLILFNRLIKCELWPKPAYGAVVSYSTDVIERVLTEIERNPVKDPADIADMIVRAARKERILLKAEEEEKYNPDEETSESNCPF